MKALAKKKPFRKRGPGGMTRRDLELAVQALKSAKTRIGRARVGIRGRDDSALLKMLGQLRGMRDLLREIRSRVPRVRSQEPEQYELRGRAA